MRAGVALRRGNAASIRHAAIGAKEMQQAGSRHQAANGKFYFYDSAEDKNGALARLSRLFVCCCLVHSDLAWVCARNLYACKSGGISFIRPPTARARRELNLDALHSHTGFCSPRKNIH
jgi:hypothetical protein